MSDSAPTIIDDRLFQEGMAGFTDKLKISAKVVVRRETGELLKSLVKLTPQGSPEKIRANISSKFEGVGNEENSKQFVGKTGDIEWIGVNGRFLTGVAAKSDQRKASVRDLEMLSYRISRKGKSVSHPFLNRKGKQQVRIIQTIVTKQSTVNKLIAKKIKNIGRLAAGWLSGSNALNVTGRIPSKVLRHKVGSRGYFIDGINSADHPSFTMANTASGVGSKKLNVEFIVRGAIKIRIKAMKKNLSLFMSGKKNVGDYK